MYRTVAQLDRIGQQLAQRFPQHVRWTTLPETSVQGRPVHALRVRAGTGENRRGVLLVGGVHARELMNPDALVELAVALVLSYTGGTDIVLGGRTWPAADIKMIMDTMDVHIVACTNPDGREYVMTVDDMWRKNRRAGADGECPGVDLNRNCDLLWGVAEGQTSCSPCTDIFVGSAAFSEPETRNVLSIVDSERIDCFVDVHSYSELVLYPWGHSPNQTIDPTRRFTTLPTGSCQPVVAGWREYIDPRDLQRFETVAQRVVQAIVDVRGQQYTPQQGRGLYGTTGTHSDWVYGRHIAHPGARKTYGYTFETGPFVGNARDSFHPADPEPVKRDVTSGLLALMQQCVCAVELIGLRVLGGEDQVDGLRRIRDEVLATTAAGRTWIGLFERLQTSVIPVLFADEALLRRAGDVVARARDAASDAEAPLDDGLVTDTLAVLQDIARGVADADVDAGVRAVREALQPVGGRSWRGLVEQLTSRGPTLR